MSGNIFSLFYQQVSQKNKIFLVAGRRGGFSFEEAFGWAGRFANVLRENGLKKGDRVAVQVEKSPEALFLYLASLMAGVTYIPLNPAYTAAELQHILSDAEPGLVICSPDKMGSISTIFAPKKILTLSPDGMDGTLVERARSQSTVFPVAACEGGDLAAILYTSGTTGKSKGAMLTHDNLRSNALALKSAWHFTNSDVLLHALPIFHTHGLFVASNVCLASSATMLFLPKFDLDEIFRTLPAATCMMGVPTYYVRLLSDSRLNAASAKHMRLFISGSAPLQAETFEEFRSRTGHSILERYGMTETNMNTSNPYLGERKPGTVGLPLPGTGIQIVGEDDVALANGEIGRILVRGPNVFKGYWRMPEKTKEEFRSNGFFVTGDVGRLDEDGYLTIIGRSKDLVITGGLNVYPKEIEAQIDEIPDVRESAVFGVPHPDFGECVTAVVVPRDKDRLTEEIVMSFLEGKLAKFKLPKRIIFANEIPRNVMGKVQKNVLRESYKDLFQLK